jgi:type I restriction-modification system DNA methylase subunit
MTRDQFLEAFLGPLAEPSFSEAGALDEYLGLNEDLRAGDEANIIDLRITSKLLTALGYGPSEIIYNQKKQNLRPDFVVRITEYPIRACFVIEDKSSTTNSLQNHRPQLAAYMSQTRAPRGLLVNGNVILAYDHQESIQTPAIEISLAEAVRAWRGASLFAQGKQGKEALEDSDLLLPFTALWRRHQRDVFAGVQTLIDDLTLQNNGAPHDITGATWRPEFARIPIIAVTKQPEALTDVLRGIIAELEDDAGAQFAAFEKEYKAFTAAAETIPGESGSLMQQEETAVGDILALCPDESSDLRERLETLTRQIVNGTIPSANVKIIKERLYEVHKIKSTDEPNQISQLGMRITELAIKKRFFLEKLREEYRDCIRVNDFYRSWKENSARIVFQSSDEKKLRREFLAQTAYLIVRIMEDKGLTNRVFTNGGIALWFRQVEPHYLEFATGRGTDYLLELAYSAAQHLYAHFYSGEPILDWYRPDRIALVRLLHALAGFDFKDIDRDIIGSVYNEYVEAEHKHESGLYYTPKHVVEFMLDRLDYKGQNILNKKLIDIASGSGGFLVSAAKRLIDAHREYWKSEGFDEIPIERVPNVIESVRDSLFGIDLNPFACALAETNLLIQVIDLIAQAIKANEPVSISKFHIYHSDTLSFSEETRRHLYGALTFPATELPVPDQVKAAIGDYVDKFDYVVGNPPYVKANENEYLKSYRARIRADHPLPVVRSVMVLKWDLFVPFVAQAFELLKNGGKMAMITSSAIETVPYASALRQLLVEQSTINEVHFFPGIRLFSDAVVENTIFILEKRPATQSDITVRFFHDSAPGKE